MKAKRKLPLDFNKPKRCRDNYQHWQKPLFSTFKVISQLIYIPFSSSIPSPTSSKILAKSVLPGNLPQVWRHIWEGREKNSLVRATDSQRQVDCAPGQCSIRTFEKMSTRVHLLDTRWQWNRLPRFFFSFFDI